MQAPVSFCLSPSGFRLPGPLPIVNLRLPGPYSLGGLTAASSGADPSEMAETRKPAVHPSAKGGGREAGGAGVRRARGAFPSWSSGGRVLILLEDLRLRPPGRIPLKWQRRGSQPCIRPPRAEVGRTPELGFLNLPGPSHREPQVAGSLFSWRTYGCVRRGGSL